MKTLPFLLALSLLWSVTAWTQNTGAPKRDIALKVVDHKGNPAKKVMVHSAVAGKTGVTDRTGQYVFNDIPDNDTISIVSPKYGAAIIPVTGLNTIVVTLRSGQQYSYVNPDGKDAYFAYIEKKKTEPTTVIDVQEILKTREYSSLTEVLRGRVAGLNFNSRGVTSRGVNSINMSSEPLFVINGMPVGSIGDANLLVNIRDIKTIEVLKNASEWGARGANGVILISTK